MIKLFKLLRIDVLTPENFDRFAGVDYWRSVQRYAADFVTDEGTYRLRLNPWWVTDYRSGSSVVDCVVPKKGNDKYNATIFLHDCAYSGWLSRELADELLRQGLKLAGLASWRVELAYKAVRAFGGGAYFDLEKQLKSPYRCNRECESLTLVDK